MKKIIFSLFVLFVFCGTSHAWRLDGNSHSSYYAKNYWNKSPKELQKIFNKETFKEVLVYHKEWPKDNIVVYKTYGGKYWYFLDNKLVRTYFYSKAGNDYQENMRKFFSRKFGIYNPIIKTNKYGLRSYTWSFLGGVRLTQIMQPNPKHLRVDITTKQWRKFLKNK